MLDIWEPDDLKLSQFRKLESMAGTFEPEEIANEIGITVNQAMEAAEYFGLDLTVYSSKATWCPICGKPRIMNAHGECPVCNQKAIAEQSWRRRCDSWAELPASQRKRTHTCSSAIRYDLPTGKARIDHAPRPNEANYDLHAASRATMLRETDRYTADLQEWETKRYYKLSRRHQRAAERYEFFLAHGYSEDTRLKAEVA